VAGAGAGAAAAALSLAAFRSPATAANSLRDVAATALPGRAGLKLLKSSLNMFQALVS